MIRDIVYYLIYVFFLVIVCYGNKNGSCFLMISIMINLFMMFEMVIILIVQIDKLIN